MEIIPIVLAYPVMSCLVGVNWVIALRLALGLWVLKIHRDTSKKKRLFWSIIVFVPIFGPIIYGALYNMPSPHPDGGAKVNRDAFYGGPGR